jgi:hypothetical protein
VGDGCVLWYGRSFRAHKESEEVRATD